jgi:hypothetical protein
MVFNGTPVAVKTAVKKAWRRQQTTRCCQRHTTRVQCQSGKPWCRFGTGRDTIRAVFSAE